MDDDRRQYRRVAAGVRVGFQREDMDANASEYLQGVAENCGLGGMFLATSHLFPKGSVVVLAIEREGQPAVEARAVVRWVNRWSRPHGMGLEFIEFEGLGERNIEDWLNEVFETTGR